MTNMKFVVCALVVTAMLSLLGCVGIGETTIEATADSKIPIKVLILPKFEIDQMSGDSPGEAQFYYEHYLEGADEYEVEGMAGGQKLYVKDGIALGILGVGKVNAALGTSAILRDDRFDFLDAYVISTGCAGSAVESSVLGDVVLATAVVDYDLGHNADTREMAKKTVTTWFHDADYDDMAVATLNKDLMEKAYDLVKDIPLQTTELTQDYMSNAFDGAEWAARNPMVLRGTVVSSDNYWKGKYDHANAVLITQTYECEDPYLVCEMEDVAVCHAVERAGMLDRLIVLRDTVNMDVFVLGDTPESLWGTDLEEATYVDDNGVEQSENVDIFDTAMRNNFEVGHVIIDAIVDGRLAA